MGCFPIVLGGGVQVATAPTATIGGSASIDASLTAQNGPDALSLSAASVTTGATLAWTVYGPTNADETAQIITAGSTSATPTWAAFTAASGKMTGVWTVKCVVTKDGLSTTYTRRVRLGTTTGWIRMWDAIPSEMADYNWSDAPNYTTHKGVNVSRAATSTFDALNVTAGVLTINTAAGTDGGLGWRSYTVLPNLSNRRAGLKIAIVAGMNASLTTNNDGFNIDYINNTVSSYVTTRARRSAGVQQIGIGDGGGITWKNTAGSGQARQLMLTVGPMGLSARGDYSETAWSGYGLAPDDAGWTISGGTPSGWYQPNDTVTEAAVADLFKPDDEADPACDKMRVVCEGDNGTTYLPAGFAVWAFGA